MALQQRIPEGLQGPQRMPACVPKEALLDARVTQFGHIQAADERCGVAVAER